MNKNIKSDEDWRNELTPEQFHILREKGTERPFTGKLLHNKEKGIYTCGACNAALFYSDTKYDSGCGWPSFYEPISKDAVINRLDKSLGMIRIEVLCGTCEGHLGHVFNDGPQPTGERYCMNSLSLGFKKYEV